MRGNIYPVRGGYQVRFGRKHTAWFKELVAAERHLNFIRVQVDHGMYDPRDWQREKPLLVSTLAEKWIGLKRKTVKPGSFDNIRRFIGQAVDAWGNLNIKAIHGPEIEDLLFSRGDISDKTRSNMRSCLHDFFAWATKRAGCPMPEIPVVEFELGWRNIIDIETQQAIIDEIKRISFALNPKIWLGVKWLSVYVSIRPGELLELRERHINTKLRVFIITSPKEKTPKMPPILDEDLELLREIPRGLPDLHFFRHVAGVCGVKPGEKFGKKYLYKWWVKACKNLGIEGVDLYGGTRHSMLTALGEFFSKAELADYGSFHASEAITRYMQNRRDLSLTIYERAAALKRQQPVNNGKNDNTTGKVLDFK